jgi:hypothetical protein
MAIRDKQFLRREKQFLSGFDLLAGFNVLSGFNVQHNVQADYTKERIREYFATHPGALSKDACRDLGLSTSTLSHYRTSLRKDWPK